MNRLKTILNRSNSYMLLLVCRYLITRQSIQTTKWTIALAVRTKLVAISAKVMLILSKDSISVNKLLNGLWQKPSTGMVVLWETMSLWSVYNDVMLSSELITHNTVGARLDLFIWLLWGRSTSFFTSNTSYLFDSTVCLYSKLTCAQSSFYLVILETMCAQSLFL